MIEFLYSCFVLIGGMFLIAGGVIVWALYAEWQDGARMRAFSANWDKLSPEEREAEIEKVRAMREVLEAKRR